MKCLFNAFETIVLLSQISVQKSYRCVFVMNIGSTVTNDRPRRQRNLLSSWVRVGN